LEKQGRSLFDRLGFERNAEGGLTFFYFGKRRWRLIGRGHKNVLNLP
jgi:hypothetical protein